MRLFVLAAVAALGLTGCASFSMYPENWTPEQIAAYEQGQALRNAQSQAFLNQQTQVLQQQAAQTPTPQVMNPAQPNGTAIVYCRDLTGSLIACKQIN